MATQPNTNGKSLRKQVEDRFDKDFNCISLCLLEKAYPDLYEHVIHPDNYDFENEEEPLYPMWNTLFEAKDQTMSDILLEKVDDLHKIGIHLMQVDETYVMMFIMGAGYSFYDSHWIPLYRDVLQWIKETD